MKPTVYAPLFARRPSTPAHPVRTGGGEAGSEPPGGDAPPGGATDPDALDVQSRSAAGMTAIRRQQPPVVARRIWTVAATLCGLWARSGPIAAAGRGDTLGPRSGQIVVGNILFRSARNGSSNPAVDTVAVGGTVTWVWKGTGAIPHNIQSEATPGFPSSDIQTGSGKSYSVTFATPGIYPYDCVVHGAAMRGVIVVR
jgi:plastocyanin